MTKIQGLPSYVTWEKGGDPIGTSKAGAIECSYADMVAIFGKPNHQGDAYKVDVEWVLTFTLFEQYKKVATIYNYKDGKNYLGEKGLDAADLTDWHIGGRHEDMSAAQSRSSGRLDSANRKLRAYRREK
jgi:hypothetical protein